ncbi:hypothetical protein [Cellulomonas timonensis]|uniref:hypothetical protein n=1 Tax=Cellulomonas timonensis TaxID=1689271 RepID=UPI00131A86B2|nr:hypothetical protein [Cellulomonas timonensis]
MIDIVVDGHIGPPGDWRGRDTHTRDRVDVDAEVLDAGRERGARGEVAGYPCGLVRLGR